MRTRLVIAAFATASTVGCARDVPVAVHEIRSPRSTPTETADPARATIDEADGLEASPCRPTAVVHLHGAEWEAESAVCTGAHLTPPLERALGRAAREYGQVALVLERPTPRDLDGLRRVAFVTGLELESDDELPGLDHLPRFPLRALRIGTVHCGRLRDLSGIEALQRLEELRVRCAEVEDVAPIVSLALLRTLDLSFTRVHELAPLASLSNLTSLDLAGAPVEDIAPLTGLSSIARLGLHATRVRDAQPLASLLGLVALDVGQVPAGASLRAIGALDYLERLSVAEDGLSDVAFLRGKSSILELDVSANPLTDLGPIASLTNLRSLRANRTHAIDLRPVAACHEIEELWLDGSPVQDIAPLGQLVSLTALHLSNTRVATIRPLSGLPGLQRLDVSGTPCEASKHCIR